MPILGVIVRTQPGHTDAVRERLAQRPGVDVALDPQDGRLILVIEDSAAFAAAATLGEITTWPSVLNTSLVYEYSGPDAPAAPGDVTSYRAWRDALHQRAHVPLDS
jgi:nitrate reductase NapAB chaperone NapD